MFNEIVFYITFAFIILFSSLTLLCKNIFYSLLSAICVFYLTAIIFFILGSEYNAIIQVAIYGFAVPVILGLGVMFTNLKNKSDESKQNKDSNSKYVLLLIGGLFILGLIYLVMTSSIVVPDDFIVISSENAAMSAYNNISNFAHNIFVKYVWAFELISIILTIIVVGFSLINKRYGGSK